MRMIWGFIDRFFNCYTWCFRFRYNFNNRTTKSINISPEIGRHLPWTLITVCILHKRILCSKLFTTSKWIAIFNIAILRFMTTLSQTITILLITIIKSLNSCNRHRLNSLIIVPRWTVGGIFVMILEKLSCWLDLFFACGFDIIRLKLFFKETKILLLFFRYLHCFFLTTVFSPSDLFLIWVIKLVRNRQILFRIDHDWNIFIWLNSIWDRIFNSKFRIIRYFLLCYFFFRIRFYCFVLILNNYDIFIFF